MTLYRQQILPLEVPKTPFKLPRYPRLQAGKLMVNKITAAQKLSPERCALLIVMAMVETTEFLIDQRDKSKDKNRDGSANASIFNVNEQMVKALGYTKPFATLNTSGELGTVIQIINKGFNIWGYSSTLDYVRGGSKAFGDHISYRADEYRNGIATGLSQIDTFTILLTDDRRIEMPISHQ